MGSRARRRTGRTPVAVAGAFALVAVGTPTAGADSHGAGAPDIGREVLADDDGWASFHGITAPDDVPRTAEGTTGGAAAEESEVYVVDTWQELRDALAGTPGGSQTDARRNTVPRIIYVQGMLDAFQATDGTRLTCQDFADEVVVDGTGEAFSMEDYIAHFDPSGPWGWVEPSGPLEEARDAASDVQAAQVQQHVGSNVTIVGVGDDAGITGANLRIRDAHNVIVRNLRLSDAYDCFPQWDPGDTGSGNWNSAYDNLSVWTSTSVWVDHNTFDDGENPPESLPTVYGRPYEIHDGLLDITHGSDLVTVSHNRFEEHDKTSLLGSSNSRTQDLGEHRVTYHDNHWIDIGQRAPRVRFGDVHVYNDFYEQTKEGLFQYYWGVGVESSIYAENNAFHLVEGVDPGRIIAEWGGDMLYETGSLVNGEPVDLVAAFNELAETDIVEAARWTPSDHYSYDLLPTAEVAPTVPAAAGAGVLESGLPAQEPTELTLVYVYKKLDPDRRPSWGNSGLQRLVEVRQGHHWVRELDPASLPADVCGPGWATQTDRTVGLEEEDVPPFINRLTWTNVLGWGGVLKAARHHNLHYHLDVPDCPSDVGPELEDLDRGLVAAVTDEGVFLSWRLLGQEVTGHSGTGMTGYDFRVYRDGELIGTVTDSTNHLDPEGSGDSTYRVVPVIDGQPLDRGTVVSPWDQHYTEIPLQRPAGGVTPSGQEYTYDANDMSVGDVDGDGQYEFVVKWDPSNSRDVSQVGYTGPVYVDTYRQDGTLLHRIDLGVNIRAGAHYTQLLVYDFDDDGRSEMMMKTAPGTRTVTYQDGEVAAERHITLPEEDVAAGYSHDDDYRLSAEGYYDHLVGVLQGWHEHPEVVAGSWPATLEEAFGIEPQYEYPLSQADAEALADHFIDVYAPSRSARNDLRAFEGFILTGPEYLTVFDGLTGAELETIHYKPGRHDDGLMWGDYAMSRIEPGNRVDRFLAGVAYLDGTQPSAVFARGYYTRSTLVAYHWDGEELHEQWFVDSGWTPMSNPFNDSPHGVDGTDPQFGTITTQGFHSLSAADVDGDGRHEVVYGAATIDDDGSLLYSSFAELPEGSAAPGEVVRLGHGDAMHVTDIDPTRPGLEVYTVHENGAMAPYGYALRDAATGEVLFGGYTGRDTGRGMVGDVVPEEPGLESWAVDLRTADGDLLGTERPGTNMNIQWAADMTTQVINGSGDAVPTVDDWQRGTLLTAEGTRTNNGTKGNPSLVADVFGDWREELLLRTEDSSAVRVYLSTEVTDRKLYTLMHDPQYRAEVARQQTTYNQPSYTSFYLGSDIDWSQVPVPVHRHHEE